MNSMWGVIERRAKAGCGDSGLSNGKGGGVAPDVEMGSLLEELG